MHSSLLQQLLLAVWISGICSQPTWKQRTTDEEQEYCSRCNAHVAQIYSAQTYQAQNVHNLGTTVDELSTRVDSTSTAVIELSTRMDSTSIAVNDLSKMVGSLNGSVTKFGTMLEQLTKQMDKLNISTGEFYMFLWKYILLIVCSIVGWIVNAIQVQMEIFEWRWHL